jgi:hypothetical protein
MKHFYIFIFTISALTSLLAMDEPKDLRQRLTAQERYQSAFWARRTQEADYKNFLASTERKQQAEQDTVQKKEEAHAQQQRDANAQRAAEVLKQEEIKQKKIDYTQAVTNLLQAATSYQLEQTQKCLEQLTAIDPSDELVLWNLQRAKMEIYVSSILNNAQRAGRVDIAKQIVQAIDLYDQAHAQPIPQK